MHLFGSATIHVLYVPPLMYLYPSSYQYLYPSSYQYLYPPQIVHGCDPNSWHRSTDGTTITLLHRAILLHDTTSACFLIRKGADINSPSRPAPGGLEGVFAPPLHMAAMRGLQEVVRCLVEHQADINAKVCVVMSCALHTHTRPHTQDSDGRCAIHVSISCKQPRCSDILLTQANLDLTVRDKNNQTPFAVAMATKDNQIGLSILNREPSAAEQVTVPI